MAQQKTNSPTSKQSKGTARMEQVQSQPRPTPQSESTPEQIAKRAYEIFVTRGGDHGHDQEDWFLAEQELRLGPQWSAEPLEIDGSRRMQRHEKAYSDLTRIKRS